MKFTVYQSSHVGGRKYNQDMVAHAYTEHALLLVLADGMGGHQHGEVAAQIAIHTYTQAFIKHAQPRVPEPQTFLRAVMQQAHDTIIRFASEQKLGGNPGSTCVAALVQDGQVHWAHAGDSRLYLLRDGNIAAVTHDHSLVQQWADLGIISPAEMKTHPERNKILNCLGGVKDMFFVESSPSVPLLDGDILLLCSDGLWSPLQDEEVASGFTAVPLPLGLAALIDTALLRDGPRADNTTAIALHWGNAEPEQPAPQAVCVILDPQRDNPESELLGRTLPNIRKLDSD